MRHRCTLRHWLLRRRRELAARRAGCPAPDLVQVAGRRLAHPGRLDLACPGPVLDPAAGRLVYPAPADCLAGPGPAADLVAPDLPKGCGLARTAAAPSAADHEPLPAAGRLARPAAPAQTDPSCPPEPA